MFQCPADSNKRAIRNLLERVSTQCEKGQLVDGVDRSVLGHATLCVLYLFMFELPKGTRMQDGLDMSPSLLGLSIPSPTQPHGSTPKLHGHPSDKTNLHRTLSVLSNSSSMSHIYLATTKSLLITHFSPPVTSFPSCTIHRSPCRCSSAIPTSGATVIGSGFGFARVGSG